MEFLVHITVNLPPDLPEPRRSQLLAAERARGLELIDQGLLVRIWRLPGRLANVSLYRVADATELHAAVSSLPLWPWMEVQVEALAVHPLEAAP
jgi:muconolactone D-isomerase